MANTTNLDLAKIASTDLLSAFVNVFNGNMDKLDKAMVRGNLNPIPDTAHDTTSYWRDNIPPGVYYFSENRLEGQPHNYFWVFSMHTGGDTCQIGMKVGLLQGGSGIGKGGIWIRNGNVQSGWFTGWVNVSGGGDLLWTNPDTSQPFAEQSVNFDGSAYRFFKVEIKVYAGYSRNIVLEQAIGPGILSTMTDYPVYACISRPTNFKATGADFGPGFKHNFSAGSQDNSALIPYKIYGIV